MRFCVVTAEYSGLGYAVRLQREGHEVICAFQPLPDDPDYRAHPDDYARIGEGMVQRVPLAEVMAQRAAFRDWYFLWDANHHAAENEQLRAEGFRVLGGGQHADRMEHDREACLELTGRYGLPAPPSHRFEDAASAIAFLQAHSDTAYVYKPDAGENFETFVPESEVAEDANVELQTYLHTVRAASFILQERKDGVEMNVEVWFVRGEPRFAFMTLESKKKVVGDLGEMVGCAFDFCFTIPLDSRIVHESVGRMYPFYREIGYTGFGDANFIAARDGLWFFEKCERFGYNAHVNLLWNLNKQPLGETLASLVDGTFAPDFAPGFGASVTMYADHPRGGQPIQYPRRFEKDIYFMYARREGDQHVTSGYYGTVLIATAPGYTIPAAWHALLHKVELIRFPNRAYRSDGAGVAYPSSPVRRYEALAAMGYV